MKPTLHFVILRFSSLGDVVLQTSVITWLKQTYARELKVTFVTSHEFKDLVTDHPDIQRVLTFDRRSGEKLSGLARKLRELHAKDPITLVLDLHSTTRSTLLRFMLPTLPRLVVDKRRIERFFLVRLPGWKGWTRWKFLGLEAQVERTPRDWQGILMAPFKRGTRPMTEMPPVDRIHHKKPYVVFAPVASFESKRWPMDYFVTLAQKFLNDERWKHFDLVVVAGPSDQHCSVFNEIQDPRLLNLQGKTKLKESIAWMQEARVVVGNDSGMNHIAEAANVPVITLFGPTHEGFGFAPHLLSSTAMSVNVWCRPCSATGARKCFRHEQVCMTQLTPERVWSVLEQKLVST